MSNSQKITLLDLKTKYKRGLHIPEIQRDYVMGAGGKDVDGQDKLTKLLDTILDKCNQEEDFDFSCIITFCDDSQNKPLEIYDGQQRLTTLIIMTLYKLKVEKKEATQFAGWYSFAGRPKANESINLLTQAKWKIEDILVTDFTSFSIKNLLEKISLPKYHNISSDYLLKKIKFDMVSIGSQNEIEQFFMDLNSGVKLKDYELYKAKLTHHVSKLKKSNQCNINQEALEMWPHKMDNQWLNFFDTFANYKHPAEEYEVAFIKYCIHMFSINNEKHQENIQIENITPDIIKQVYEIMQVVINLDFKKFKKDINLNGLVYYSWGESDSDIFSRDNYNSRGAFWKLDFVEYDKVLYYILKNVLLNKEESKELKDDVLLWCFITTLKWQGDVQKEYLRLIKIILNHNIVINNDAWYECQGKGQYLYYCKYSVYGIPQYYGKHIKSRGNDDIQKKHLNMFLFNKLVTDKIQISNTLNREKITNLLMEKINKLLNDYYCLLIIKLIINKRISCLKRTTYDQTYIRKENFGFGINPQNLKSTQFHYYLSKVNLNWPARGRNSPLECWIRLKCRTDLIFETFNETNDAIVHRTIEEVKKSEKTTYIEKSDTIEEFIDKCFWTYKNEVNKLIDRVTRTSTTYNKYNSDSGWCRTITWNI